MPDAPRERNWAALMEAAKRKPRTDNDALEAKFGESAKGRPAGFELAREGSSPSSPAIPDGARGEDLYEPVGTMPVVGDTMRTHVGLDYPCTGIYEEDGRKYASMNTSKAWMNFKSFATGEYRILKRKPRKQVDGRVYLESTNCGPAWLRIRVGERMWYKAHPSNCSCDANYRQWREHHWGEVGGFKNADECVTGRAGIELHGPEADAIIRECVSAMGLDTVAVRVDIGHGAQIDCKAARAMRGTWVRIYANGLIIPCEENDPDRIGYVR